MPNKDAFTLKEIADILKVPESTCRQWDHRFKAFLTYSADGDTKTYSHPSLEIFQRIAKRVKEHKGPAAINAELSGMNVPTVMDKRNLPHSARKTTPFKTAIATGALASLKDLFFELAPAAKRFLERIVKDAVNSALRENSDSSTEIRVLNRKISELESKIDRMAEMIAQANENTALSPSRATPEHRPREISALQMNSRQADDAYRTAVLKAIVDLKDKKGLTFLQIAELFEKRRFAPFGKQPWHPIGISALYQRARRTSRNDCLPEHPSKSHETLTGS